MEKDIILFLNAIGISNRNILKILNYYSSYEELKDNQAMLKEIENLDIRIIKRIQNHINFNLKEYKEKLYNLNIQLIFYFEENYPINLKNVDDYPLLLYYKGKLMDNDKFGISIVGSRKCTSYGAWACEKFARELSQYNIPIISGLAYGIDKISHETALNYNNRTVAILGNGIDIIYPKNHSNIYEKIEKDGLIMTEYPLGTKPNSYNFPYRNRIISGIGQGILVIEAMEKSGTLITSNYAAEQGKEVFVIPGNINSIYSKGTNKLIQDGAKILLCIEDILDEIKYDNLIINNNNKLDFNSEEEKIIYEEIAKGPISIDVLTQITGIKVELINTYLTMLELNGYIIELKGGKFSLK